MLFNNGCALPERLIYLKSICCFVQDEKSRGSSIHWIKSHTIEKAMSDKANHEHTEPHLKNYLEEFSFSLKDSFLITKSLLLSRLNLFMAILCPFVLLPTLSFSLNSSSSSTVFTHRRIFKYQSCLQPAFIFSILGQPGLFHSPLVLQTPYSCHHLRTLFLYHFN